MALIDDIKIALRITSTAYNSEISDLILAAKADLALCGLVSGAISDTDALIERAITLYCKANFGYSNQESEKLQQSYEMLRNHLSLSTDYAYYAVTFTVKNTLVVGIREAKVIFTGYLDTEATDEQIKYTNDDGVCIFYVRIGSNYKYVVSAEDYISDDDEDNLIDISAATAIAITLIGA